MGGRKALVVAIILIAISGCLGEPVTLKNPDDSPDYSDTEYSSNDNSADLYELTSSDGASLKPPLGNKNPIVSEIIAESTRKNYDPLGRPLPLAAGWNTGSISADGFTLDFQLSEIEKGHHLLPWTGIIDKGIPDAFYQVRDLGLPIAFLSTQWESMLYNDNRFLNDVPGQNALVISVDGKVQKKVSPFGPVERWREVGENWGGLLSKSLFVDYPNPPKVFFISNNEARRLSWVDAEYSRRYLDNFGRGRSDEFKREVFSEGWIERYRAMIGGFRDKLGDSWKNISTFVGYDAFATPHYCRWNRWKDYSLYTEKLHYPNLLMWEGGSPSYYLNPGSAIDDHSVYSPQIESMNWVPVLEEAQRLNPDFWFEISVWDGYEGAGKGKPAYFTSIGQSYTPARYEGFVKFGMWLLRPRVVREFRSYAQSRAERRDYWDALVKAVDLVYKNETLKRFWRHGKLVTNVLGEHPYQEDCPSTPTATERWYLLTTNLDPPRPWRLDTEIPVFSIALEYDGRWLIYAHSPLADRSDVEITIPAVGTVTVDVSVQGNFFEIDNNLNVIKVL